MSSLFTGVRVLFGLAKRVTVGFVVLDATVQEIHTQENEVTEHPIESGAAITDHIRRRPDEIQIEGTVSGTPVQLFGVTPLSEARPQAAFEALSRIRREGELVVVTTSIRIYTDMALTSFIVNRNADTGRVLSVTLRLREVITVAAQRAILEDPANGTDSTQISQGTVPTTPAGVGQTAKVESLASSAFRFFTGS